MKSAFTDIFIKRPVLAIVVNVLVIIAGLQAINSLTVRQYPRSENSVVTITTPYVGASAELVRGFITTPIERAIAAADGIDYIESSSSQGLSTISARLKLNYEGTKALSEISAKVNQVRGDLPPEAEIPSIDVQSADTEFAAMYLTFSSDQLEPNEVTDYLVRVVQPALSAVTGVQRAEILGGRVFAIRIWLKPELMAAYNISPLEVRQALAANNALAAVGQSKGAYVQVNLTANTDLKSADEFRKLVVRSSNGTLIRLGDIADVQLGAENYDADVRFSGDKAVFMGIFVLPNANSLDVVAAVKAELDAMRERFPVGFTGEVAYDGTKYINSAIHEVIKTLTETLAIVVLIIFLFIGSFRAVLVPVLAIPISLIGAVFLMQVFGFTINLLTLLAIVLSVGIVVDDAIVVLENIERHVAEGLAPIDAAIKGARELVGPVISMTITLAAVYAPIAISGGLTGSLFREFAITLSGAVLISGFVALTLSPMMASRMIKPHSEEKGFQRFVNHTLERMRDGYRDMLRGTMKARWVIYAAWGVIVLLNLPLFILATMTTQLAPTEDQGVVFGVVDTASNSTIENTVYYTEKVNEAFMSTPSAEFSFQITQPTGGFGGVIVDPWEERDQDIFTIRQSLFPKLGSIAGISLFPVLPAALPGGSNFPVEFIVSATADSDQVYEIAKEIAEEATKSGFFAFPPTLDVKFDEPRSELVINRDRVADLGLNLQQVSADLGVLLGGNYVNRFSIGGRSYKVIPQVERTDRLNPEQLLNLRVTGPNGELVPVSAFATIEESTQPRSLNRFNQLNSVKIQGIPKRPLDQVLKVLEASAAEKMPAGYRVDYAGESRQLRTEGSKFGPALGLALVLIFLVLAAQFNSFRDPFIILLGSVPLALFGALLFIAMRAPGDPWTPHWSWPWTTSFNIYSQVGMITLIGLISKHGILIVEFANHLQQEGKSKFDAALEAAVTRFRPILMTTAATVFGHIMLVFVSGAGAEARNSIGLVLVNGMIIGTFFTLFIVPSLYILLAKDVNGKAKKPSAVTITPTELPGSASSHA